MFRARLDNASTFKKILEAIKDFVADANWDVTAAGISLQAMDSSHVALVAIQLWADGFEAFHTNRGLTLGTNLASMAKIMKCAGNTDSIVLESSDQDPDVMTFTFENEAQSKTCNFELRLLDIDGESFGIPEQDYDVVVEMESAEFTKICRDLMVLGDTVTLSATREGVLFSVSGDLGNGNVLIKPSDEVQMELNDESVSLEFALRYLNFFARASALSDRVTVKMLADTPLVVEYEIETLGYIRFYLAPKIQDE